MSQPLVPLPPEVLHPQQPFTLADQRLPYTVLSFWQWAASDLRHNLLRGWVAEFIVAQALGVQEAVRDPWATWDLTTPAGVRLSVKAAAYLQSWTTRKLSDVSFSGLRSRAWEQRDGAWTLRRDLPPAIHADAVVFCLHTATSHEAYDTRDVGQWRFHLAPAAALQQDSITLRQVERRFGRGCRYEELAGALDRLTTARQPPVPTAP